MNRNHLHLSKYLAFCLVCLLAAYTNNSCKLPKELSGTDTLKTTAKFTDIPDSTQAKINVPAWRNFLQDSLLVTLIDTAINNNIDLKIATQRIFKAQADLNFSRNAFYPNLDAKATFNATK